MQYALLLYSSPDAGPQSEEDMMAEMPQWFAYTEEITQAGAMKGGEALQMPDTATTVRVRDGQSVTTDGPFAETKEILGGFYLIDVPDLDAALEWAAKIPSAPYGSVEVRPVMELPDA
ncbi:MAG: YciI family protein [Acidimicrobiales bacterium]|nr:YciI family protein [Acidimicrobiales bacterium]RZV47781.1 MAG: YciI family protein [Acidimicrobiales bacterium]